MILYKWFCKVILYNLQNIRWKRRSSSLINICWYIFLISSDKIYLYLQKLLLKINPIILLVNNNNCYFFKRNSYNKVLVTMNSDVSVTKCSSAESFTNEFWVIEYAIFYISKLFHLLMEYHLSIMSCIMTMNLVVYCTVKR